MESNVQQPNPQFGVGFGPVVKFREIYVLHSDALSRLGSTLATAVALGDVLRQSGENEVLPVVNTDTDRIAGLASYEAVVNSTGIYGYKPQAGDPMAIYKKGRFYIVNVEGVVAKDEELVVGTVAGSLRARPGSNTQQTVGVCVIGNNAVAGDPIEADIDTTVVQAVN